MGLISMKCPACGAVLENVDESREFFFCTYCGNKITYEKQRIEMTGEVSLAGVATAKSLLTRGNNALEDGKFIEAKDFFDRALDSDPYLAEAYMGKLAAINFCNRDTDLQQKPIRFTRTENGQAEDDNMILYRRAMQYAKGELHDKYAWINGPYHLAICDLHEATQNIKNLENQMNREHKQKRDDLEREVKAAESRLKNEQGRLKNYRGDFANIKKYHWKDIVKPVLVAILFLVLTIAFSTIRSSSTRETLSMLALAAFVITVIVVLVRLIKILSRIAKSYQKRNVEDSENKLVQYQRELPVKQRELQNYLAQEAQENQRFAAYASSVLQPLADKVQMFKENS